MQQLHFPDVLKNLSNCRTSVEIILTINALLRQEEGTKNIYIAKVISLKLLWKNKIAPL